MRFLVIGLGSMGKRRIRNLFAHGEKNIVGFDPSPDRRKESEEKHGIKTMADLAPLPSDQYDALIISTPPNLHAPYMRKALAERKHFFVETTTSDEAYADIMAAPDDGTVRAPSCSFRHLEPIKRIKRMIEDGTVGKVLAYQYHLGHYLPDWHPWEDYRQVFFSKKETGACRELFPFELTWLNWLLGAPVVEVGGELAKVSSLDMDADDLLMATLKHENGVRGEMLIDVVSRKPLRLLRLLGSEGVIEWDWIASRITVYHAADKSQEVIEIDKGKIEDGYIIVEEMYDAEMKAFLDAIAGRTPYPFTFTEMWHNLKTLFALEAASRTGQRQRVL